jgi:hypothetical protein
VISFNAMKRFFTASGIKKRRVNSKKSVVRKKYGIFLLVDNSVVADKHGAHERKSNLF